MKNAVVAGATGGIGSGLVKALEQDGYNVISVSQTEGVVCDLSDYSQIQQAVKEIKRTVETIDLLVNSAGVATYKNLVDVSDDDLQNAFMVNTIAPTILMRELSPLMAHQDTLVLNIGSGMGTIPTKGRSIYCATKFALRGISLSLSKEFEGRFPRFCLITLGSTLTEFGPMTLEEKQKAFEDGKAYFPVEWVINKLMEIIQDTNREPEITLFPSDYGFGVWKQP